MNPEQGVKGVIPAIVRAFILSKMSVLLLAGALFMGLAAIMVTPKEEEPQIVVPMADVMVQVPGAAPEEVEKLVTAPLERILWQIDGVEYVYSTSRRDQALVTVRFFVGQDREDSLIKLHNAITKNRDLVPAIVTGWAVKPVEIDDTPILMLTLHSRELSDHELRRAAEELYQRLAEVEDVSRLEIHSGRSREIRVELRPELLAGYSLSPLEVAAALQGADISLRAGTGSVADQSYVFMSDSFLRDAEEVRKLVVGVFQGRPVYLGDVARVIDGPEEAGSYSRIGFGALYVRAAGGSGESRPAVTIGLAKKKGTNAVEVAEAILAKLDRIKDVMLPDSVSVEVTRNYGRTAQDKVSGLLESLVLAIITVVALLALTLGWREALVVALAVPVSFSLALFVNYFLGFTINRVTLFALILSLGLVVDDPITNVDNIQRHMLMRKRNPLDAALEGVAEVLPPVIMSTLAIIACFLPLFFITGMMGPYMAPMAANVPLTVTFSTLCALTIVPWMAYHLLKNTIGQSPAGPQKDGVNPGLARFYRRIISPFLDKISARAGLVLGVVLLLIGSLSLVFFRLVPLKMLPFDNKNELQLVLDLDEGATLERTDRAVRAFEDYLATVPEVMSYVSFSGAPSPMDFNGMVRHYYWRESPNLADIRIVLADKSLRKAQSHAIHLRIRQDLERLARENNVQLKIVESPPGPPVISTITAEIYAIPGAPLSLLQEGAAHLSRIMREEPGVVDVDNSFEAERDMVVFVLDKEKGALHGVSAQDAARTLAMAVGGEVPARVHAEGERSPLPVRLILPRALRASLSGLNQIKVRTRDGSLAPLGELGRLSLVPVKQPIMHKNLKRVAYVFAETAGIPPGEAVLDMGDRLNREPMPAGTEVEWAGEGEWKITLDVFRDLGIAFAAALAAIYILLVMQTNSFSMPVLIMTAIPLTLIGIMPGFWLLNLIAGGKIGGFANPVFFTATSMIGMIALGGIVIRNSLVLIDFIRDGVKQGHDLKEAVIQSGAVRLRPIVLTALTTALGAWPITLDPIFSGLAWALIFGLAASTLFTLIVIPTAYYAMYKD